MDWLIRWFEGVVQGWMWQSYLDKLGWVDWFTLIFLILGILYGIQNGLMAEIAEVTQMIIVIYVVHEYYKALSSILDEYVKVIPPAYDPFAAFVALAIVVWMFSGMVLKHLRKLVHTKTSKPLKYLGGALLGSLHLFIIYSFLTHAVILLPLPHMKKVYEKGGSHTGYYLAQLSPNIYRAVGDPIKILTGQKVPAGS